MKRIHANLKIYPKYQPSLLGLDENHAITQELHVGDLSGNSLLLLWILITAGLVRMDDTSYYDDFYELYSSIKDSNQKASIEIKGMTPRQATTLSTDFKKLTPITPDQKETLSRILNNMHFVDTNIILCLYGDEVGDRLGSDWLMLQLLLCLAEEEIPYKILASNHLHFFVTNLLSTGDEDLDALAVKCQGVSLLHLIKSIDKEILDKEQVLKQVEKIYKFQLNLIGYTFLANDKAMAIRAHAPFDLQSIVDAGDFYKIKRPHIFKNAKEAALYIDSINAAFKTQYVYQYFSGNPEIPELDELSCTYDSANNPIGALLWEKNFKKVNRPVPECFKEIEATLYHGHTNTPSDDVYPNRFSLNSSYDQKEEQYELPIVVLPVLGQVKKLEKQKNLPGFFSHKELTESSNLSGRSSPASSGCITPVGSANPTESEVDNETFKKE